MASFRQTISIRRKSSSDSSASWPSRLLLADMFHFSFRPSELFASERGDTLYHGTWDEILTILRTHAGLASI